MEASFEGLSVGMPEWLKAPIQADPDSQSGRLWDDDGYDQLPVKECSEEMVDVAELCDLRGAPVRTHPVYDGVDYYTGERDPSNPLVLPYGAGGGKMLARRAVAEGIAASQSALKENGMQLVLTDLYRHPKRQASGFVKRLLELLDGDQQPGVKKLYMLGKDAAKFFSRVNVDKNSTELQISRAELLSDPVVKQELEEIAQSEEVGLEVVADQYLSYCANIEAVREFFPHAPITVAHGVDIPLAYENTTHPTGGAFDALIAYEGRIVTPSGFDYPGKEGSMTVLDEYTFENLQRRYCEDPTLRAHCRKQFDIEPENLTQEHFNIMRIAMRALYHATNRAGATHYSGEFQHKQFGLHIKNPRTGDIIYSGKGADRYPGENPGNTCHSIQTMTRERAIGVFGGNFALQEVGKLTA